MSVSILGRPGDAGLFLLSDGRLSQAPVVEKTFSLSELKDAYGRDFPAGIKEANTRSTEKIHVKHFRRILITRTRAVELRIRISSLFRISILGFRNWLAYGILI